MTQDLQKEVMEALNYELPPKIGDTVCLKSGGPSMTIEEVVGGQASCVWFDKINRCRNRNFPIATLTHNTSRRGVLVIGDLTPEIVDDLKTATGLSQSNEIKQQN